jgi:hypothetical protein
MGVQNGLAWRQAITATFIYNDLVGKGIRGDTDHLANDDAVIQHF